MRLLPGFVAVALCWIVALFALGRLPEPPASPGAAVLIYLASFAAVPVALALVLRVLHGRHLSSLLGPGGLRPRQMFGAAAILLGVSLAGLLVDVGGLEQRRSIPDWLAILPLAVPLIAIQSASEELVFRGYLLQGLAARWKSPLFWALAPALFFGTLHWSPAVFGQNALAVVGVTVLVGLVLADVTARTGNLSAAIGLHVANNLWAFLVLAPPSSLAALALFTLPVSGPDSQEMGRLILLQGTSILLLWGVWRLLRARLQSAGPDSI